MIPRRVVVLDVVAIAGLLGAALLLRLPNLLLVPRLTDETGEVLLGLRIARGEVLPLVGVNTYIGALFSYLVAGAFLLYGPHPEVGRLTALAFGILGVIPTYLLGRRLGGPGRHGRAVGAIAGLLLAASSTDILVTSRIAYSHSLTPFFATLGLWLLHRAVTSPSGRSLALSGAAFGLALQTHLSALAIWPGLGLYLLIRRRSVGRLWVAWAGVLAIGMVANIVAYNLLNLGATVDEALLRSGRYGGVASTGLDDWPRRLAILLRSLAFSLGGRASEQVEPPAALLDPPVLLACLLVLAGLALLARRREWLPPLVAVSAVLAISLLNDRVEPVVVRSRHYALLLPLGFVLVAVSIAALHRRLGGLGPGWLAHGVGLVLVATLVVAPQAALRAYVSDRLARPEANNLAFLRVDAAIARGSRRERVYLDGQLAMLRTMSGGRLYGQMRYLLILRRQEYEPFDFARQSLPIGRPGSGSRRIVLSAETVAVAAARYRLVPLPGEPGEGAPVRAFRAYARTPE